MAISYQANIAKHTPGDMEDSMGDVNVLVGDDDEWRRAAYEHGPKWVVWKGRLPGIIDTWYEIVSRALCVEY